MNDPKSKHQKMGRPPKENPANKTIGPFRVTAAQSEAYKAKAKQEGMKFSDWVRAALDRALNTVGSKAREATGRKPDRKT